MLNIITFCVLIYFVAFLLIVIDGSNRTAINKRLAIYKRMLHNYEANTTILVKNKSGNYNKFDFSSFHNYSMCWYLNNVENVELGALPELLQTKPIIDYYPYWFRISDIESRIKCIKQAIFITETKLKRKLILNTH